MIEREMDTAGWFNQPSMKKLLFAKVAND